jgi:hypothetical protein
MQIMAKLVMFGIRETKRAIAQVQRNQRVSGKPENTSAYSTTPGNAGRIRP